MKQQEFIGEDTFSNLPTLLESHNASKIFLVTGKQSFSLCGAEEEIKEFSQNYKFVKFNEFHQNPRFEDVKKGIKLFNEHQLDVTVAIGGGSVIDMAKLISSLAPQPEDPSVYIKQYKSLKHKPTPLIAIPTTAGSGSEATHFAVVYIDKVKYSLAHPWILPDIAIVDPVFTHYLPQKITAISGMDALCQAIEAYWSVNSTPESKKYSSQAIKIILEHLVSTYREKTSQGRLALAQAAHLAGKAINLTKTTAAHAFSYPFTSYFGIPHGHAVSLTIGELLDYNRHVTESDIIDNRGVQFVQNSVDELIVLLGGSDVSSAKQILAELMDNLELERSLSALNIDLTSEWETISQNINLDRLQNNPRKFTPVLLKDFFSRIE
jgi:alcohol dehydrogenase class IV